VIPDFYFFQVIVETSDEEKKGSDSLLSLNFCESRVEKIAIFLIPLIFALFNFVYWANYADRVTLENGLSADSKMAY
jgi:hypothetical protein